MAFHFKRMLKLRQTIKRFTVIYDSAGFNCSNHGSRSMHVWKVDVIFESTFHFHGFLCTHNGANK